MIDTRLVTMTCKYANHAVISRTAIYEVPGICFKDVRVRFFSHCH